MKKFAIAMIMSLFAMSAEAAEFKVFNWKNSEKKFIVMTGGVEEGDAGRLTEAWLTAGVPTTGATLFLNSPGGDGKEMRELAKVVANHGMKTVVHAKDICMSACAVVWAHGADRVVQTGGRLGFHIGSIRMTPESVNWLEGHNKAFGWQGTQLMFQERMQEDFEFFASLPVPHPELFVAKIALFGSAQSLFWEPTMDELWIIGGREWVK